MKTFADLGINIDKTKNGNQKTICPKCSHTRKNRADPCLSVNIDEGVYYCHHCEWKGSILKRNGNGFNQINTTYDYPDEHGKVFYQKVRAFPKKFWLQTPDGNKTLNGVKRVLYRLPELINSTGKVFIAEGEKDCDTLFSHGLTATCNDSGAGNWKPEFNKFLKDRDVVILEDNDEKGRKHGNVISEGLHGIAKRIKIIRFEELPQGGDVSDYLADHTKDDLLERQNESPLFTGSYSEYFNESKEGCSKTDWENPILFNQIEAPEIEASSLPSWLGNFARAVSENTQTPPAMAVLMGLSVTATCLQNGFVVSPYGDNYVEPLSIWTATILPPATRKTAVLSAMTAPLSEWEYEKAIELKEKIAENETIRMVNTKSIDLLQNEASKCNDHDEKKNLLYQINELKLNTPEAMYPPRLWTGDVTPERLQNLLAEHRERMSVLSDEGGIFEIMSGLYSNGVANMDVFLKGHAGSSVRVDRGNREAHLNSPALSFGLTVQPEVASKLSHGNKKHFRGNGTLARFIYALPKNNVGQRDISQRQAIPETIKNSYHTGVFHLLDIFDKVRSEQGKPNVLVLDHEARDSWKRFAQYIETNQGEGKEFESIQDWTGKLPGASLRIAGLCHVVEHGEGNLIINRQTMERSLDLCEMLIKNAQATFELMGGDQICSDAQYVLKWVIEQHEAFFKRSDCQQSLRSRFRRVGRLIKALEVLTERHYISPPEKLTTKKPTVIHHINPRIFEGGQNGLA